MSNANLHSITNSFQDVHLASLASWRLAHEIIPRDHGGPYVVIQEGYNPEDLTMTPDEFILGRSGTWLSLSLFYRMPAPERRAEFIFGTAAEVMQMMSNLPSKVVMLRPGAGLEDAPFTPETHEMAAALKAGKSQTPGPAT